MNTFWMVVFLIVGIYVAIRLTQWANYFAFGENMERRLKAQQEAEVRAKENDTAQAAGSEIAETGQKPTEEP